MPTAHLDGQQTGQTHSYGAQLPQHFSRFDFLRCQSPLLIGRSVLIGLAALAVRVSRSDPLPVSMLAHGKAVVYCMRHARCRLTWCATVETWLRWAGRSS